MNFIDSIIRFSLKNRLAMLVGGGVRRGGRLVVVTTHGHRRVSDLTTPTVVVMTDALGMAAEEVERLGRSP